MSETSQQNPEKRPHTQMTFERNDGDKVTIVTRDMPYTQKEAQCLIWAHESFLVVHTQAAWRSITMPWDKDLDDRKSGIEAIRKTFQAIKRIRDSMSDGPNGATAKQNGAIIDMCHALLPFIPSEEIE